MFVYISGRTFIQIIFYNFYSLFFSFIFFAVVNLTHKSVVILISSFKDDHNMLCIC
jgi:cellulose synthase/poly-beta-1,6-N-acetylglucosamine synthase-like glycosyltransferase